MVEIEDKIVSSELWTENFCCDLGACRGECCVEGNSGAPLEQDEVELLAEQWPLYKPYMKAAGVEAIESQGFGILDLDGDLTTPLINDAECAYSIEHNGGTWCAVEKAYFDGKCTFRKPISCHLYPIREVKFSNGTTGLQYHRWSVCRAATRCGTPIYVSLRDAIIRRWGEDFYRAMVAVAPLVDPK